MRDLSEMMRGMLIQNGIKLDDPAPPRRATTPTAPAPAAIDRAEVRRILVEQGAPEHDLDWLTASCPSIAHARAYRPTIITAGKDDDADQP
jgi:hypothetical protein